MSRASSRLTYVAQGANVAGAVVTFALIARGLPTHSFARYAALMATLAVANAVAGVAIGTRATTDVAAGRTVGVVLTPANAGALCLLNALFVGLAGALGCSAIELAAASLCFVGAGAAEFANARILGQRRFDHYAALAIARNGTWIAAGGVLVWRLDSTNRLFGALLAFACAAVPSMVYVAATRGVGIGRSVGSPLSGADLGTTQLGLWLIACADRIILAHVAPLAAAHYAAVYSPLDRAYRTLATAEASRQIPERVAGAEPDRRGELRGGGVAILVATALSAVATGPSAVRWMTGGRYAPSFALTALLVVGMTLMVAAVPLYAEVVARGRRRYLLVGSASAGITNLALNVALIPRFGANAAAVNTAVAYAIWFGVMLLGSQGPAPAPVRELQVDG